MINGDEKANLLKGLAGADTINGHEGDDTIIPNRPANADGTANTGDPDPDNQGSFINQDTHVDNVNGGDGTDTLSYEGESDGVTASLVPRADDASTTDVDESETTLATIGAVSDLIATESVPAEEEGDDPPL